MLVNVYNGTAIGNHSDSLCHISFFVKIIVTVLTACIYHVLKNALMH